MTGLRTKTLINALAYAKLGFNRAIDHTTYTKMELAWWNMPPLDGMSKHERIAYFKKKTDRRLRQIGIFEKALDRRIVELGDKAEIADMMGEGR